MLSRSRLLGPAATLLTGLLTLLLAVLLLTTSAAPVGGVVARADDDSPLAGVRWGVPKSGGDPQWAAYQQSSGRQKRLLGRIALQPTARWFGAWIPDGRIASTVDTYLEAATGGDPDVLAQLTVFRVVPWEQAACQRLPTKAERASYKRWIRRFVAAVGDEQRAAVVLQPDGPFAQCAPGGSRVLSRLVSYAARRLGALDRTTTYIDAGSAGWNHLDPANAVTLLRRAGVAHVRGFHLNTTHYESVPRQVEFGARVVAALAGAGLPGKAFTVDTAENGRPFTWQWHMDHRPRVPFNHAPACRTKKQRHCVTLGIPPTADVAAARWRLPERTRDLAREHVDGYLWAGRPWLHLQSYPFERKRALRMARTTPYQ